MNKRMDSGQTKLAVRAVVVGYRSAKKTGEAVGGPRGDQINATAETRAGEILDEIDNAGTDADDEKRAARREIRGTSAE